MVGWASGDRGQSIESCSLITTDANKLASEIHDRMPVILDPKDYDAWLDVANDDHEQLQAMLAPFSTKKDDGTPGQHLRQQRATRRRGVPKSAQLRNSVRVSISVTLPP
jgi:putative SOS response-associated peptidase YedK